jgi:hypothetical protein
MIKRFAGNNNALASKKKKKKGSITALPNYVRNLLVIIAVVLPDSVTPLSCLKLTGKYICFVLTFFLFSIVMIFTTIRLRIYSRTFLRSTYPTSEEDRGRYL